MGFAGHNHGFLVKGHGTGQGYCPWLPQGLELLLGGAPLVCPSCVVRGSRQMSSCGPGAKACGLRAQFRGSAAPTLSLPVSTPGALGWGLHEESTKD